MCFFTTNYQKANSCIYTNSNNFHKMYLLGRIFISVYCCPLKLFIIFTSPFYAMRYNLYIFFQKKILVEKCVSYIR